VDGFVKALDRYCSEIEQTTDESPLWKKGFLKKMEWITQTCDAEPGAKS
jgi:hypothetical protein